MPYYFYMLGGLAFTLWAAGMVTVVTHFDEDMPAPKVRRLAFISFIAVLLWLLMGATAVLEGEHPRTTGGLHPEYEIEE